jgi:hypothetical protein
MGAARRNFTFVFFHGGCLDELVFPLSLVGAVAAVRGANGTWRGGGVGRVSVSVSVGGGLQWWKKHRQHLQEK